MSEPSRVVSIICAVFPLLQKPRNVAGQTQAYRARVSLRWPFWISDHDDGLGEEQAKLAGRLLESLTDGRLPVGAGYSQVAGKQRMLGTPFAKHAPSVLVAYVRAATDPTAALPTQVRQRLEMGVFSLCDIVTSGRRGRGREGEGIGLPFGLGEGSGGEAEREIWADLWQSWSKKRYAGQG